LPVKSQSEKDSFHELRHSHATIVSIVHIPKGSISTTKSCNIKITLDTYSYVLAKMQ